MKKIITLATIVVLTFFFPAFSVADSITEEQAIVENSITTLEEELQEADTSASVELGNLAANYADILAIESDLTNSQRNEIQNQIAALNYLQESYNHYRDLKEEGELKIYERNGAEKTLPQAPCTHPAP